MGSVYTIRSGMGSIGKASYGAGRLAAALPRAPRLPVPSIIKAKKGRESSPNYRARKGTYSVQYCCLLYWAYILGLYTNIRWLEQAIQVCKLKRRASSQADPVPQPEEAEERDVVPS